MAQAAVRSEEIMCPGGMPAFLADSKRLALGVDSPRTGAEVQRLLEEAYRTPPNIVARLRTLSLH